MEPVYESLYPHIYTQTASSAPPATTDAFSANIWKLENAETFCRMIERILKDVTVESPPNTYRFSDTVSGLHVYSPRSHSTTIINSNTMNNHSISSHNSNSSSNSSNTTTTDVAVKKTTPDTGQHLAAIAVAAVVVPVTTWLVAKDYSIYKILQELENMYILFKGNKDEALKYTSGRVEKFMNILLQWKNIKKQLNSELSSSITHKTVGGGSTLCFGLSLVFGSTLGLWAGGVVAVGIGSMYIWKQVTKIPDSKKRCLLRNVNAFLELKN